MLYSRNAALHAVRLVLRGQPQNRGLATAAVDYGAATESRQADTLGFTSMPKPTSFLEADDAEYQAVALPPRDNTSLSIPWPTIFPHSPQAGPPPTDTTREQLQCDVLAHFIQISDLEAANRVLAELQENGVPIHHRAIYLHAAVLSLSSTEDGREQQDFLKWFELYPNRPANRYSAKVAETWEPITSQLIQSYADDAQFLSELIVLGAKKGLLPALMPTLFAHVATIVSPRDSLALLERAILVYKKYTTSLVRQSSTSRAARVSKLVEKQCQAYRGKHLQYLSRAGWKEEAKAIYNARKDWDEHATEYLADLFTEKVQTKPPTVVKSLETLPLPRQIRATLHRKDVTPAELAPIQHALQSKPSLLARFEQRFTHPSNHRYKYRGQTWLHALILSHARAGQHAKAVEVFANNFLWVGLPPIERQSSAGQVQRRKTPSIQIITSVLPSVLALLPKEGVAEYHKAYKALHPTLPPALQASPFAHLALTRHSLRNKERVEPIGTPASSAVLCALAGDDDWEAAEALLTTMESRGPEPNERTYTGLVAVLLKMEKRDEAREVLDRMRKRFGDDTARGFLLKLKEQLQV